MGSQGPSFAVLGLQQHQRQASRSMAKSAAGGKGGEAGAGAGKGARKRRGWFKLWSVNNHRLRFPHEQIWPTLKLTDEQAAEFRRNSRLFVVDLGRTITLKNKFSMNNAAAGGERPSPSVAYSLLHETNMHLDAVGEHPR